MSIEAKVVSSQATGDRDKYEAFNALSDESVVG